MQNVVVSTAASDQNNTGYHDEGKGDKRGYQECSDRMLKGKAVMPLNNIIVCETYLGYYPVISKPREDVRSMHERKGRKNFAGTAYWIGVFGAANTCGWAVEMACARTPRDLTEIFYTGRV